MGPARLEGLVSDRVPIIEVTRLTAHVDLFRPKKTRQHGEDDDHGGDRNLADPEAHLARKHKNRVFTALRPISSRMPRLPGSSRLRCLRPSLLQVSFFFLSRKSLIHPHHD
jgi:hypothetical protein